MAMAPSSVPAGLVPRLRAAGCVFAEEEAALLVDAAADAARPRAAGRPTGQRVPLEHAARLGRVLRAADRRRADGLRAAETHRAPGSAGARGPAPRRRGGGPRLRQRSHRSRALAAHRALEVHAVDIDPAAVACARRNLPPDRVLRGRPLRRAPRSAARAVALVAANAPYVPTDAIATMPAEARDHEARVALDGGDDGLTVQRRVIAGAPDWLAPGRSVSWSRPARPRRPAPARRCATPDSSPRSARTPSGTPPWRWVGSPDLHQQWYSGLNPPPLDFAHRGQPRYGDGLHPHVRRSPGGGWLRSGAVALSPVDMDSQPGGLTRCRGSPRSVR